MLVLKRILLRVAALVAVTSLLVSSVSAQFIIGQQAGTDFLAFEAEDAFEFVNGDDATGWGAVIAGTADPFSTRNGIQVLPEDPSETSASRGGAIFDFPGGGVSDYASWKLQFVEPGDYSLYISYTMYDIQGDANYGNEDSIYVSSAFGTNGELVDTPADPRGDRDSQPSYYGNLPTSGGTFGDGQFEGNFVWWNAEADNSDPTAENKEGIYTPEINTTLDFGIAARERGVGIDRIVFHKNPDLSDEELDALPTFAPNTGNPGDFNDDGNVDLQDFVIMAENFNRTFSVLDSFAKGDQTRDGNVDLADFVAVRQILAAPPAGAAVPEPSGAILACVGLFFVLRCRKRTRR